MLDKAPGTIQRMFASVAHRYDRANRILSARFDVGWRKRLARSLLPHPGLVLDVASGTGDLAVALGRWGNHRVIGGDFTFEMLLEGRDKLARAGLAGRQLAADALRLPFRSAAFDGVTVAFGIRNFADPKAGLVEMRRVVRSGGVAGILEFSTPRQPLNALYSVYFRHVLPTIGGAITGSRAPYEYLPASVTQFPEGEELLALMREAGFDGVTATRLSGGIATFYRGEKS